MPRLLPLVVVLALGACNAAERYTYFDRDAKLQRDDFREMLQPPPVPPPQPHAPPIPEMQSIVALPGPTVPAEAVRQVSISTDETVPLREVLYELARQAGVDLELDPRIEGSVIFNTRSRPFDEVVRRISDLAGLRHSFDDGVLRVELDEPYFLSYRINQLNLLRRATSQVETSVSVSGISGEDSGSSGSGGGNTSESTVSGSSEADFWQELEGNLQLILASSAPRRVGRAGRGAEALAALPTEPNGSGMTDVPSLLRQFNLPLPGQEPPPAAAPARNGADSENFGLTVNRQAGVISVFASERQHRFLREYLTRLLESVTSQVLIEARVLEVELRDEFSAGINWRSLFGRFNFAAPLGQAVAPPPFDAGVATQDRLTLALTTSDLSVIANLIEEFGTVRTLSSPRLTVLQNQTAVLKVAENQVFFEVSVTPITDASTGRVVDFTLSSTAQTVPVGVIITVQPHVDVEQDQVTLALRPTITRIARFVDDPAVAFATNNQQRNPVPVVAVQELDSVVTMPSGQVLIMGGLMQDFTRVTQTGVPLASEIPVLGGLFRGSDDQTRKTELVIFLRATISRGSNVEQHDADLYRRFGGDRRPLNF